ncbi:hypothetical protein CAPTEDRAFT_226075 [Capitella teleta]|uniref:Cadherin domain-containing protein n=1 Tax=Capitella teleta TaxID=283909 RepID=R7URN3_CAPTE|nr:hypothetical protein CAPTEDRAFT_226075 [Capitella teleta]|eukprot:ELU08813.1 hypothetical protein CAPTEDRAFT_226075 [Capitella teleta]
MATKHTIKRNVMLYPAVMEVILVLLLQIFVLTRASNKISYSLYEEAPAYTYVGNVPQASGLNSSTGLQFSILSTSNPDSEYFIIDELEGILRTRQKVDREVICPKEVTCQLKVDVAAKSPPDVFEVVKIIVDILDENDNAPQFSETHITRSIPENTQPGRSFSIPLALDLDSPKFGVVEYREVSGSTAFLIKVTEDGTGKPEGLYIVLKQELDREDRDLYQMTIAALDGGVPARTGTLALTISVQDVNDHPPQFTQPLFTAEVEENAASGEVVTSVAAVDEDEGENGVIVYSFDAKTVQDYGGVFSIDSQTGLVTVTGELDREDREMYELLVTAQDKQGVWLPSEAKVRVTVLDQNDNAPLVTIHVETMGPDGQIQIYEDEPAGSYIAYISVKDPDSGRNSFFSCALENPDFQLDVVNESPSEAEYTLVTSRSLDREVIAQYAMKVVCADQGDPVRTSSTDIVVNVLDVNDNLPFFSQPFYSADVAENLPRGTEVAVVTASDPDATDNGRLKYSFAKYNMYFSIDAGTGRISTKMPLDHEQIQNYTLVVIAEDHGSPPANSTVKVIVNIVDLNDEAPVFTLSKYTMGINELAEFGSKIGQVAARDPDSVSTGEPVYTLVGPADIHQVFSVSQNSGEIFTKTALDRETTPGYSFIVKASDAEDPSLSSTATVSIYLIDANDNAPVIDFPSTENNTIHMANTDFIGQEVTRIRAHDIDASPSNQVAYYLTGTEDSLTYFSLNEGTGQILTRHSLKDIVFKSFRLNILIRDSGSPPKTVSTQIYIMVNSTLSDSYSRPSSLTSSNMAIVIAVVTISAVLIILLIVAIVVVKRNDDKLTKSTYIRKMFAGQVLDNGDNAGIVEDGCMQTQMDFTQDVSLEDEEDNKQIRQISVESSVPGLKDTATWQQFYGDKGKMHEADRDSGVSGADSDSGRCSEEVDSSRPSFNTSMEQDATPPRPPSRQRDRNQSAWHKQPPAPPMFDEIPRRSARDMPRSRREVPPTDACTSLPPKVPPKNRSLIHELNASHLHVSSKEMSSSYV